MHSIETMNLETHFQRLRLCQKENYGQPNSFDRFLLWKVVWRNLTHESQTYANCCDTPSVVHSLHIIIQVYTQIFFRTLRLSISPWIAVWTCWIASCPEKVKNNKSNTVFTLPSQWSQDFGFTIFFRWYNACSVRWKAWNYR